MIIKKVKYLHILWHPDLKFNPNLVRMINNEPDYFNSKEHLFVTPHENVYNSLKEYENVVLAGKETGNLINKFGKYTDWIFVHSLNCSKSKVIFTRKKFAKKVIWRTWGHDIRNLSLEGCNPIAKIVKKLFWQLYIRKVHQFRAFGIGNDIDNVNICRIFGDMQSYRLSYFYEKGRFEQLQTIRESSERNCAKQGPLRILIGHSASPFDNHIDAMAAVEKYKDEDIKICMILSYGGQKEYVEKVKEYANRKFPNKVEIVDTFMSYFEFASYLSNIDVAIFNQEYSTALGNLSLLLFFKKMIYFKKNSEFTESFDKNSCGYKVLDDIKNMSFNSFVNEKMSTELIKQYNGIVSSDSVCKMFANLLSEL